MGPPVGGECPRRCHGHVVPAPAGFGAARGGEPGTAHATVAASCGWHGMGTGVLETEATAEEEVRSVGGGGGHVRSGYSRGRRETGKGEGCL
jgi:hypothetical protein